MMRYLFLLVITLPLHAATLRDATQAVQRLQNALNTGDEAFILETYGPHAFGTKGNIRWRYVRREVESSRAVLSKPVRTFTSANTVTVFGFLPKELVTVSTRSPPQGQRRSDKRSKNASDASPMKACTRSSSTATVQRCKNSRTRCGRRVNRRHLLRRRPRRTRSALSSSGTSAPGSERIARRFDTVYTPTATFARDMVTFIDYNAMTVFCRELPARNCELFVRDERTTPTGITITAGVTCSTGGGSAGGVDKRLTVVKTKDGYRMAREELTIE